MEWSNSVPLFTGSWNEYRDVGMCQACPHKGAFFPICQDSSRNQTNSWRKFTKMLSNDCPPWTSLSGQRDCGVKVGLIEEKPSALKGFRFSVCVCVCLRGEVCAPIKRESRGICWKDLLLTPLGFGIGWAGYSSCQCPSSENHLKRISYQDIKKGRRDQWQPVSKESSWLISSPSYRGFSLPCSNGSGWY